MRQTKHINVEKITISAKPGAEIGECIREAILLAVEEYVNVKLIHNEKIYTIYQSDLVLAIRQRGHNNAQKNTDNKTLNLTGEKASPAG